MPEEPPSNAAEPISLAGKTLAHYEVREKIGQGAMGQVYRAWDTKLGREVAIKALPAHLAADPDLLARLEREARLLASLNHPNIATIHGIEESGGLRFLVLEMVEGDTLAERIARGPLPVDDATILFRQIAQALGAAHEKGIIHRDLKPANIKITPTGRVKVLDFGLAKVLGPPPGEPGSNVSQATTQLESRIGMIVGTIAYMSPEQARGKTLDERTDIWSFGCVLYEALSGTAAFRGENAFATIAGILEREPDWSALPAEVPPSVRQLLRECLDKNLARRPAKALEAGARLGTRPARSATALAIAVVAAAVAISVTSVVVWRTFRGSAETHPPSTATTGAPTVAVATLDNLTGREDLDWLGGGLANLVRDRLAESRHVVVVSRPGWDAVSSAVRNGDTIVEAGTAAGIDYILSGEILSSPDGLVLTARVMDLKSGVDVAARHLEDLRAEDLLASADSLALLTKQALKIPHKEAVEVFAADFKVDHIGAYEAYLAGLEYFLDFSYTDAERALRSALELEPTFHMARYRLAHVLAATGRAEEAFQIISEIPEDAPLTRRERLYVQGAGAFFHRDYETAKGVYQTLLDEYPYEVEARQFLAEVHDQDYEDEAALQHLQIIAAQEPQRAYLWVMISETHLRLGQLDKAEQALARYMSLEPENPFGFTVLGRLNRARGETGLAIERYRHALRLDPDFHDAKLDLAVAYVLDGKHGEAEHVWRQMVDDAELEPGYRIDAAFELCWLLRAQGRFDESVVALQRLEPSLRAEQIREAEALALRGLSRKESGDLREAARLIDLSIERSPKLPTRYLVARGLLQLERGELDGVRATAEEIRGHALAPEDPDRTEEKAATYLEGMADLVAGDAARAMERLRMAVDLEGYPYASYRLALASAVGMAGRPEEAARIAAEVATARDLAEPRLDLELDRVRALLLQATLHDRSGRKDKARQLARAFLDRWSDADAGHRDLVTARRLAE